MFADRTQDQIRKAGLEALARELGPVDMIRFLRLFEHGTGDYTEERQTLFAGETVDLLVEKINERRAHHAQPEAES